MKKMDILSQKKTNGGLSCPYCKKYFFFFFGWEKRYDNHVKDCDAKYGNFWLSK